jgi:F-type H+-transporting ATPase subunit b
MSRGWLTVCVLAIVLALFAPGWSPVRAAAPEGEAGDSKHPPTEDNIFKGGAETAIWTLAVFLVLLYVLGKFAWPQILAGLDKREQTIAQALEEARKAQEEAQHLRAELQQQRERAAGHIRSIMDEARRNAQQVVEDMKTKGQAEIAADRDRMLRELQMRSEQLLAETIKKTSELATLAAAKAIRRELNSDDHRRLVDEALAEMGLA